MKQLFTLLILCATVPALAGINSERIRELLESQTSCGSMVRFDERHVFIGFGSYRRGIEEPRWPLPNAMTVMPMYGSEPYKISTEDSVVDLVTEGNRAFVLTYSSIEEWDLETREKHGEYKTYDIAGLLAYKQHSMAFARYQNKIIIAHGRLGVSFFDMNTKQVYNQYRLVQQQLPLESMAMGVTVQGKYAYVMMDNYHLASPAPFRGIIVIDMETEKVVKELPGLDPGVTTAVSDQNYLIVSYAGNPVWKFSIDSVLKAEKTLPAPLRYMRNLPVKGHPTGAAAMDVKYYYTCFFKAPSFPGENGGIHKKIPMVLDRQLIDME